MRISDLGVGGCDTEGKSVFYVEPGLWESLTLCCSHLGEDDQEVRL